MSEPDVPEVLKMLIEVEPEVITPEQIWLQQMSKVGRGPKLTAPPEFIMPKGIPPLDSLDEDLGPPIDKNDANARAFLRANPQVWVMVLQKALRATYILRKKFSFRTIVENIRWNHLEGVFDMNAQYGISNSYSAHFSRYARHYFPVMNQFTDFHHEKDKDE
jgi:hypothetical protein